jgi:hypothetical protein
MLRGKGLLLFGEPCPVLRLKSMLNEKQKLVVNIASMGKCD